MSGVGSSPTSVSDTSQILLAGVPDGFSRETPVFLVFFIFIFYLFIFYLFIFFATHSFVISHAREIIKL